MTALSFLEKTNKDLFNLIPNKRPNVKCENMSM